MDKIFGNRFKVKERLSAGAQGEVYRVEDKEATGPAELALKRLKKPKQFGRFLAEIEALYKIDHPNVIKVIAHSDAAQARKEQNYWFVMPLAIDNLRDRAALYAGNLDGVLHVSLQLADALIATHSKGIIHRDVKPGNILFSRKDHEVWLSDFGICFLEEAEEHFTQVGEVVGPRHFTAPELESGGKATEAVDVYSLGKVIYFMLTGGRILPREETRTPEFFDVFKKGERYRLLQALLTKMIAPIDHRLKTMKEVRDGLIQITKWEETAQSLSLAPEVLACIEAANQRATERKNIQSQNQLIRQNQKIAIDQATESVVEWLEKELLATAAVLEIGSNFTAYVDAAAWHSERFQVRLAGSSSYIARGGIQLTFQDNSRPGLSATTLKFFVCNLWKTTVTVGDRIAPLKEVDPELAVIPYIAYIISPDSTSWNIGGFVANREALAKADLESERRTGRRDGGSRSLIDRTFAGAPFTLMHKFTASQWPSNIQEMKKLFSDSIATLVEFATSESKSSGP